jgi:succinoglycan biosynthesis transport protein ExoP
MMHSEFPPARPFRIVPLRDGEPRSIDEGPISLLRSIGSSALRHKFKLAAWVALCLGAAFMYARMTPPTYTASASLLLEPRRQTPATARETVAPPVLDISRTDSELQVMRSERLLNTVFEALALADHPEFSSQKPSAMRDMWQRASLFARDFWQGAANAILRGGARASVAEHHPVGAAGPDLPIQDRRRIAFDQFARKFSARRVGQAYVIEIAYESTDPKLPARVANAAASAYILQSVAFKADTARTSGEFLQGRLDALSAQVNTAFSAVQAGEIPTNPTPDADAKIIGGAQVPLGPSAPRTGLILGFGGIFGLLSGVFFGAIGSVLDRRIRRAQDIVRETGLPCLAVVPEASTRKGLSRWNPHDMASLVTNEHAFAFTAAIRNFRTSIEISRPADRGDGGLVIAIGGWRSGVGTSTLAINLAQLMDRGGRQVSILTTDPSAFRRVTSSGSACETMVDAIAENVAPEKVSLLEFNGVRLMPIRSANPQLNRFVDFRDPRAARIIAHARRMGDVLIDLPPFGESADALALATHADMVILVAAQDLTTVEHLNDTCGRLHRAGASVLGVVLNRSRG